VSEVHDLHVWSLSSGAPFLTAHAHARDPQRALNLAQQLCRKHGIAHATLQISADGVPCREVGLCCK
jgi:Co/Zn/Cd efflux system component